MNEIIDYNRTSLIDLIDNINCSITEQYNFITELDELCPKYTEYNLKLTKTKKQTPFIIFFTLLLLALIIFLLITSKIQLSNLFEILLLGYPCILILLIPTLHFNSIQSINRKTNEYNEQIHNIYNSIMDLRNSHIELQLIPFRYQTPSALLEIKQYLINYRANNWTEAVNILEDTIHKNYMVYLQSKQTSTLNEQLDLLNNIQKNTEPSGLDIAISLASLFT